MLKYEYGFQPEKVQLYETWIMIPRMARFFLGIIIDTKPASRQNFAIIFNVIISLIFCALTFEIIDTSEILCASIFVVEFAQLFVGLVN